MHRHRSTPVDNRITHKCNVFCDLPPVSEQGQEEALRVVTWRGLATVRSAELFEAVRDFFAPYAERRKELLANPDGIRAILAKGAEKARYVANKTMRKVRKKAGLAY
jgi:tryptophanyl-tRNA synthetase